MMKSRVASELPQEGGKSLRGLLIWFLLLRIVGLNSLPLIRGDSLRTSLSLLLEVSIYSVTAALIWRAGPILRQFNIDRNSVIAFVLFGVVLRTGTLGAPALVEIASYLMLLGVSIRLVVLLRASRSLPPSRGLKPALMGLVVGGLFSAVVAIPGFLADEWSSARSLSALGVPLALGFVHAMSHSAILEEPVFRGFLWGYLDARGWGERRIWLAQAGLFWLAHARYVATPYTFWFTVPASGLLFGWMAWKSRSVFPSMIAHGFYNALSLVLRGV